MNKKRRGGGEKKEEEQSQLGWEIIGVEEAGQATVEFLTGVVRDRTLIQG